MHRIMQLRNYLGLRLKQGYSNKLQRPFWWCFARWEQLRWRKFAVVIMISPKNIRTVKQLNTRYKSDVNFRPIRRHFYHMIFHFVQSCYIIHRKRITPLFCWSLTARSLSLIILSVSLLLYSLWLHPLLFCLYWATASRGKLSVRFSDLSTHSVFCGNKQLVLFVVRWCWGMIILHQA